MGMALIFAAAVFSATAIWLVVRIANRRERWAKWALATLVTVPVVYVLSFGPACHLADQGCISVDSIRTAYRPVLFTAASRQAPCRQAIHGYAKWCGGESTIDSIILEELIEEVNSRLAPRIVEVIPFPSDWDTTSGDSPEATPESQ